MKGTLKTYYDIPADMVHTLTTGIKKNQHYWNGRRWVRARKNWPNIGLVEVLCKRESTHARK